MSVNYNNNTIYSSTDFQGISSSLMNLETMRQSYLNRFKSIALIFPLCVALFVACSLNFLPKDSIEYAICVYSVPGASLILYLGILYTWYDKFKSKLDDYFEEKVHFSIINLLYHRFKKADGNIVKYKCDCFYSGLTPVCSGNPYFRCAMRGLSNEYYGTINGVSFSAFNVYFGNGASYDNAYAFVFDCPANTKGKICVSSYVPVYMSNIDPSRHMQKVSIPCQWNSLVILADDENEARQVLTPDLLDRMARIRKLSKSYKKCAQSFIRNGKIEFYLPYVEINVVKPSLFKPLDDNKFNELYQSLDFIFQVIEVMVV